MFPSRFVPGNIIDLFRAIREVPLATGGAKAVLAPSLPAGVRLAGPCPIDTENGNRSRHRCNQAAPKRLVAVSLNASLDCKAQEISGYGENGEAVPDRVHAPHCNRRRGNATGPPRTGRFSNFSERARRERLSEVLNREEFAEFESYSMGCARTGQFRTWNPLRRGVSARARANRERRRLAATSFSS
jgi:hypothetical protein